MQATKLAPLMKRGSQLRLGSSPQRSSSPSRTFGINDNNNSNSRSLTSLKSIGPHQHERGRKKPESPLAELRQPTHLIRSQSSGPTGQGQVPVIHNGREEVDNKAGLGNHSARDLRKSFSEHIKNKEETKTEFGSSSSFTSGGFILALLTVIIAQLVGKRELKAEEEVKEDISTAVESVDDDPDKNKTEKVGFRDRKIIDYENRIRSFSTPDKIFRYFASYKLVTHSGSPGEILMTPQDFLRSITPGLKQPDGVGLDQYKKYNPQLSMEEETELELPHDSIFRKLSSRGLISFSDYIFLLTMLATSRRQFEIAFRMFDLNGDGDVDAEEFSQVQNIIRAGTSWGKAHKDHHKNSYNTSAIMSYFFGEKMDGKLTIQQFLDFQTELQNEILRLEFTRKEPGPDGTISEKQLAELLLAYAEYPPRKKAVVMKRVKRMFKEDSAGVTLMDYKNIFSVLVHIEDIDKALTFHHLAGSPVGPDTLHHVAQVCAGVDLSPHIVQVMFTIFDEDGDGALSKQEFITVMRNKLKRGLEKPKDTGISNMLSAMIQCAKETATAKGKLSN